jgi:hypothetical protein
MSPDYYEMLRITPAASFEEVHKAYRLLAMQFHPDSIAGPIVRAAHGTLLKQGWIVAHNTESTLLLENEHRAVRVSVVARLDSALLKRIGRQFAGFSVVLAVEIETRINLSLQAAVIDLMRSSHHGAPFPDDVYRQLFAPFL